MKPVSRHNVSKSRSAGKFSRSTRYTKTANIPVTPMRGGWRF